ncbi:MAG: HSP20 family protein [Parcubacteria group bacterium Gr01-1014_3]|nr:MAG: HSP20 family protein [Parcubacteria group bacterium Gr01-1014_3]
MNEEIKKEDVDMEVDGDNAEVEIQLAKSGSSVKERKAKSVSDDEYDDDGQLTIDVYQSPDEIILESPIAGVRPEDVDVSITNESVTIKGKREHERRVRDDDYFYQECYWGRFSRSIILPQEVDAERSEAFIKNGVLTVRMPKLNRQRSKKLHVKSE